MYFRIPDIFRRVRRWASYAWSQGWQIGRRISPRQANSVSARRTPHFVQRRVGAGSKLKISVMDYLLSMSAMYSTIRSSRSEAMHQDKAHQPEIGDRGDESQGVLHTKIRRRTTYRPGRRGP